MLTMRVPFNIFLVALVAAQDYTERFRPQYHFTPPENWINDPNGLIFHEDEYHLFYQYSPNSNVWNDISWGHAVSADLTHWKQLPIALNALKDRTGPGTEMFFSGSAVADSSLVSGYGNSTHHPLIAIYTSYYTANMTLPSGKKVLNNQQAQSLAYSTDNGLTWTEDYANNPIIELPPSQYADQWQNFRDPYAFWYEPGQHWVLVASLANLHILLIYHSTNLKDWTQVSQFGPSNVIGGQWECPGMFPLPVDGDEKSVKWVVQVGVNPSGPFPLGSGVQYFIGSFDGTTFTADATDVYGTQAANWVDYGPDHYATTSYNGLADSERIAISWMNDWSYGAEIPTTPWRSAMTLPRKYALKTINKKIRLVQTPMGLKGLESAAPIYHHTISTTSTARMKLPVFGKALDINLAFAPGTKSTEFGIDVRTDDKTVRTTIGYHFGAAQLYVDRIDSGNTTFYPTFRGIFYAPLEPAEDGAISLRILLDWSSIEVFGGCGETVLTAQIFPPDDATGLTLWSLGETSNITVTVNSVKSAWK
ncbi:hypothetical protein DV737_g3238, partial [Chaetothyriales sp. CBS 132003]